uniref:Ig-like domain-containing protein n=1 Tax=Globodera rostochiensis TaxID=31243 RepID=A0A914H0U5_GLORO
MVHFFFHLLLLLFALPSIDATKSVLSVQPKGVGLDQSFYLVNSGSRLELQCELNTNATNVHGALDFAKDGLKWMRGLLPVEAKWLSMYTESDSDPNGNWVRNTLVIQQVDDNSKGDYRCVYFGGVERHVHIHLIEKINWRLKSDKPGGQIGAPLTIDCGAYGVPNENIKIMDQSGSAIEESAILIALGEKLYVTGHEMTIEKLKRSHRGMKIRCFAIRTEMIGGEQDAVPTIHTDERNLTVDVWEPPHFAGLEHGGHFYVKLGSPAVLRWRVNSSNPPVLNFTIKRDGKIIGNDGRREIKIDEKENMASLMINKVLDEDYDQYTCIAHNGKLRGEQNAFLDKPNPPKQPKVWAEQVTNNSVRWHVEERTEAGLLPVIYFQITYRPLRRRIQQQQKPKQNLDSSEENAMASDNGDDSGDYWQQQRLRGDAVVRQNGGDKVNASGDGEWKVLEKNNTPSLSVIRHKNPENVFDIVGLDPFTEYEFTFEAFNQAGNSDPVTIKQETVDYWELSADDRHSQQQRGQKDDSAISSGSISVYVGFGLSGLLVLSFIAFVVFFVDCHDENVPTVDKRRVDAPGP